MSAGVSDAISTLRWGLRRYALLFLACFLAVAALIPAVIAQIPTNYDAPALIVAQRLDMALAALPRYAEETFDGGQVARAVAAEFGDDGDFEEIVPGRVSMVAEQDSIVLVVIGHGETAQEASDVANVAATTFVEQLNLPGEGVGAFSVQSLAVPPLSPEEQLAAAPLALSVGIAAGLITGLAAVMLLLIVRRPVLDAVDMARVAGVPVLGTVAMPRLRGHQAPDGADVDGLVAVCRRLLAMHPRTVLLMATPGSDALRGALSVAMASVLGRVRSVCLVTSTGEFEPGDGIGEVVRPADAIDPAGLEDGPSDVILVDGPHPLDFIAAPESSVAVLVVVQGISERRLSGAVAEHLGGQSSDRLLMVRRRSRLDRVGRKRRPVEGRSTERHPVLVADG